MVKSYNVRDAQFVQATALPDVAVAGTTYTVGLDLGLVSTFGARLEEVELKVSVPALAAGQMANNDTMKLYLVHDTTSSLGGASVHVFGPHQYTSPIINLLGAGGVGCAAASVTLKIPSDLSRYVGLKMVHTGTGVPSTANVTVELLF